MTAAIALMRRSAIVAGAMVALALCLRLVWLVIAVVHGGLPIENEGAEYARLADNLRAGLGYIAMRGAFFAHEPPLYAALMSFVTPLTHWAELGGRLISAVAGSLLVLPVYVLASYAYGKKVAAYAAFLTAVHPFLITMSTTVLSETLFTTFAVSALALTIRALARRSTATMLCSGAVFGLAYLTRQEGLAWALLAASIAFAAIFRQERRFGPAALRVLALVVPLLLLATPYWVIVARHTGHFAVLNKASVNWIEGRRILAGMPFGQALLQLGPHLEPLGPELSNYPAGGPAAGPRNIGEAVAFAAHAAHLHARQIAWNFHQRPFGSFAAPLLAFAGFVLGPWTRRRRGCEAVFCGYVLLIFTTTLASMFLEESYLVEFVPFVLLWTARGLAMFLDACTRLVEGVVGRKPAAIGVPLTALSTIVAIALVVTAGLAERAAAAALQHAGVERSAGAWIMRNVPNAVVMDQGTAIAYYAHARRWLPYPWGDGALAQRYIDQQRPDVVILIRSRANELPYLAAWTRDGIPDSHLRRAIVLQAPGDVATIYVRRHE
jgi:4-amino-4-deoxy-L-arabinose transferase-like glycosyltransferase